MVKNRVVKFRVSEQQYNKIIDGKNLNGFFRIADYARYKILSSDNLLLDKLAENNKIVHLILNSVDPIQYKRVFSRRTKHSVFSDSLVD